MPTANAPAEPDFVCADPILKARMRGLAAAVRSGIPVHISGETGTGKELMARHVHALSGRAGAFVAVNCGAVPESLFVAELFGHERGAYTNARQEGAPGLARLAEKGTLFLDEVGEVPLAAQSALLRLLDTREVRAVGAAKTTIVDVQIVSATNRDLEAAVATRAFRADLYYRLCSFGIHLPPLRERADFDAIVVALAARQPGGAVPDATVLGGLRREPWPGNIRQLHARLRRLAFDCTDAAGGGAGEAVGETADCCAACGPSALARARCRQIRALHAATGGNVQATARQLGISRTTVYKHVFG